MRVIKKAEIQMKSEFFNSFLEMYNKMGDSISIQYGGSIAHHASMGKKKGLGVGELITSVKRHFNNVVIDPSKQRVFNLFLGIFIPSENAIPIWNILDETADSNPTQMFPSRRLSLPNLQGKKWFIQSLQEFENWLPKGLQNDLRGTFLRNPDSDSDDPDLNVFIE